MSKYEMNRRRNIGRSLSECLLQSCRGIRFNPICMIHRRGGWPVMNYLLATGRSDTYKLIHNLLFQSHSLSTISMLAVLH